MKSNHSNAGTRQSSKKTLTDEDIYLMVMLHSWQKKSCRQIARQFGVSTARVYEIIARRSNSGCCG